MRASWDSGESNLRPISRFTAYTVFFGLVRAWRFAIWPTSRSPFAVKPTMEGVVRAPSWLGMTWGTPPSITATHEFVVPRSMPIIFPTWKPRSLSRRAAYCTSAPPSPAPGDPALATLTSAGRSSRSLYVYPFR